MGGKKKDSKKGKKVQEDEGDESTEKLLALYRRKCIENQTQAPSKVIERLSTYIENGGHAIEVSII